MGEGGNKRPGARRGVLIGAAGGLPVTLAFWLYFELTRPSAYSRLVALAYGPLVIVFAGLLGLVLGATQDSD